MDIQLRPISLNDTEKIIKWRNNDFVKSNFIFRELLTPEMHENWYNTMIKTEKAYQFIIMCGGKDIGSAYLRDVDLTNKKAEIGLFIGEKEFLGKGLGKQIVKLTTSFGFENLKLNKIFARVLTYNSPSFKSFESAGYVFEGTFAKDVYIENKYYDVAFLACFNEH